MQEKKRVIKITNKSDSATGATTTSSSASSTTAKKVSHSPSTSSNSPNRKVSIVPMHFIMKGIGKTVTYHIPYSGFLSRIKLVTKINETTLILAYGIFRDN